MYTGHLEDLADQLDRVLRGEEDIWAVAHHLVSLKPSECARIWSDALRRFTPPPPPRPWWRRIWSIRLLPTPDHRPGGPWR